MTELDTLKQLWQEGSRSQTTNPISMEEFMALIQARTADIKKRTVKRVRKEILTYVVLLVVPVVMLFARHGVSLRAIIGSLGVFTLLGLTIGALSYKEYRLRTLPLGGSLREALSALIAAIDSTSRFYMATYMTCVVVGVASFEGFLLWRHGLIWVPVVGLVIGVVFVAWCYQSGHAYLQRMFGNYRAELMNCLTELERV